MRKTTLKQVRRAERRGVSVREGGEGDVALFFRLMTSTCARQGTLPQPASEAAMLQVWRSFHREGKVRMTFAEVDGEAVATLFCLDFGDRVSAWKKGWSGAHEEKHPNVLLSYEAIQWAHRRGARQFDFMGFDRDAMKQGVSAGDLQAAQQGSLYWFNLGFGSQPRLLPESFLYFGNGLLRAVHRSHLGRALLRLGRAAFLRTLNP